MNNSVPEIMPEGGHSVSIDGLPKSALNAIVNKLNERNQKATKVYRRNYKLEVNHLKSVMDKIVQEFAHRKVVNQNATVSVVLESNQRFQFSSWQEFCEFDSSQSEKTKSVSLTMQISVINEDASLESYKVQISIQNAANGLGIMIGPIALQSIDDAGIPPVPMHISVEYNSFILGKNIISTIEQWEKSLPTIERPVVAFLQKRSSRIKTLIEYVMLISGILFCRAILASTISAENVSHFGKWLVLSSALIVSAYYLGRTVSRYVERYIDRLDTPSAIRLTQGDNNHDAEVSSKNRRTSWKALAFLFTCLLQIALSVMANPIWGLIEPAFR